MSKKPKDMTKAELLEHVSNLEGALSAAELTRDEARGANRELTRMHDDAVERNKKWNERVNELVHEKEHLGHRIVGLQGELKDAQEDRDNWKDAHGKLDQRYGKMRRMFIRQSHLAGELAKETGNVDLNITW